MATPPPSPAWPDGKRFAFAVVDDTDVATVDNTRPVYDLLERLGMCATKTVWPVACPEGSPNFATSQTLDDPAYLTFVLDLQRRGFEITWHGATMESSRRERTAAALESFRGALGHYPRIHINHAENRENLYWGPARLDEPLLRSLVRQLGPAPDYFVGHVPNTPFWWGDLCARHFTYARNLTFDEINLLRANPTLPYRDRTRPLVAWWFSASDAEDVTEFNSLLRPANQKRLEAEGGLCIVATHFGKGFAPAGEVHSETRRVLERLTARPGWFPSVGMLLDWLREQGWGGDLPAEEWRRMQWRWARDLVRRKLRQRVGAYGRAVEP